MQRVKAVAQRNGGAGPLRFFRKPLDQSAALDNKVGMFQGDVGGASIGKKLEAANFVDDAPLRGAPSRLRIRCVTISVRSAGSSVSMRSNTRTETPCGLIKRL